MARAQVLSAAPPHRNPEARRVQQVDAPDMYVPCHQTAPSRSPQVRPSRFEEALPATYAGALILWACTLCKRRTDRQKRDDAKEVKHGTRAEKEERTYFEPANLSMGMGGVSTGQGTDRSLRRRTGRVRRGGGGKKVNQEEHLKVGGMDAVQRCILYTVFCVLYCVKRLVYSAWCVQV